MILKKETLNYYQEAEGFSKEFNPKGKLTLEKTYRNGLNIEKVYEYNSKNELVLESITETSPNHENGIFSKKIEVKHQQTNQNTRSLKYLKGIQTIYDINSTKYLLEGKEVWQMKNDLLAITDYFFSDKKIHKTIDYDIPNQQHLYKNYTYNGERLEKISTYVNCKIESEEYFDEFNRSVQKKIFLDDKVDKIIKSEFSATGTLLSKKEFRLYADQEFLSFQELNFFDETGRLVKSDRFGRFREEMILISRKEIKYSRNEKTTTFFNMFISPFSEDSQEFPIYFGHYNEDDIPTEDLFYSEELLNRLQKGELKIKPNGVIKEELDLYGNVVESISIFDDKILEHYIYSFEYINTDIIEMETCFRKNRDKIEKVYTHKYYYY